MKNLSFISMAAALTVSLACSNTFEFIDKALEGPVLYFGGETSDWRDSVKVFFKSGGTPKPYEFRLTPGKVGSLRDISVTLEQGTGTLTAGGAVVPLDPVAGKLKGFFKGTKDQTVSLAFTPAAEVEMEYELLFASRSTTGLISKKNISTLTLTAFKNVVPKAKFTATVNSDSKYNFTFDASATGDGDQKFGGKVEVWQYTVTGPGYNHTFRVNQAKIQYSFPGPGAFTIVLLANDQDGGNSLPYEQKINIQ